MAFEFTLDIPEPTATMTFSFEVVDAEERPACQLWCFDAAARFRHEAGRYSLRFDAPSLRAYKGQYTLRTALCDRRTYQDFELLFQICPFDITTDGMERQDWEWNDGMAAYVEDHRWTLTREDGKAPEQRGEFTL